MEQLEKKLRLLLEELKKARVSGAGMQFAGEHGGKTKHHGKKTGPVSFPHYDFDTSSSDEDNFNQAKAHFKKLNHPHGNNDVLLRTYLKGRKAEAQKEEA